MSTFVLALLWLGGCTSGPEAPAAGVVATIGDERIVADDLRSFAVRVPTALLSSAAATSRQQQYLRALIARRLLAREVSHRGIDTSLVVDTRVADRLRQRLTEIYRRERLWPGIEVDEDQAMAYFDSLGLQHQRLVAGIVVSRRERADSLHTRLRAGDAFRELAQAYSEHRPSALRGGDLGYLTAPQAADLGISASIYDTLADSLISPVLPQGEKYQIIRFLDSRSTAPEEWLPQIRDLLLQQQRQARENERLHELAQQLQWQVAQEGLEVMARRGGEGVEIQPWLFDAREAATPLFTYAGRQVSVGQFLGQLARHRRSLTDTADVAALGDELLRTEFLLAEAARRAGIAAREEILTWQATLRQELAITEMRRQLLAAQPPLSDDDVRSFYRQRPELFRRSDDILIVETLLATEAEAQAVRQQVETGASLLDIARRTTLRDQGPEAGRGTLRLSDHERMTNSILYEAVRQASLDQVVGPVAVQGGYSVFQIIQRETGALMPYLEVEARAGALARKHYQNEVFDQFVDQLLEKHDDEIHIYTDELAAALPDSLIDQLVERDRIRAGLIAGPRSGAAEGSVIE